MPFGIQRLGPFRLRRRVAREVVFEQHFGQPQMPGRRRTYAVSQRRPGTARVVLLAQLKLGLAETDDDHLARRIELAQQLPGLQRALVLAPARGDRGQGKQRIAVTGEAHDRAIENGGGLAALPAPDLAIDELDGKLGVAGDPPRQLFVGGGSLLLAAESVVERDQTAADLAVARRLRHGGTRRLQRAFQIALGVADLPEHVPLHRARRTLQLAGQRGQRGAVTRHRERE